MTKLSTPGPLVGVVGGGQLGRMLGEAASPLGIELLVLDPTPNCPAVVVSRDQIIANFDDEDGIYSLAERVDILTFEIELADQDLLERVQEETGTPVHPDPSTLRLIHDKFVQKQYLDDEGIPVPSFRAVESPDDIVNAMDEFGSPVMLKARTGGYDGRGNVPVTSPSDAASALEDIAGPAMVEEFVDFSRELSVIGAKGADETKTYPPVETIHKEEILRESLVPARSTQTVKSRATAVAEDVLSHMNGRGVYGIELFETISGEILVNEIAPRPHNTGHWTIEGAVTSQFSQHLRAVLGWPLGSTALRSPTVMSNILGDVDSPSQAQVSDIDPVLTTDNAHLHWYGKAQARPLRKMGHVTVSGESDDDPANLLTTVRAITDAVTFSQTPLSTNHDN